MAGVLILPSPWLGEWAYAGLAEALDGSVAPLPPANRTQPDAVLDLFTSQALTDRPRLVVAHSNAGLYAPAVATVVQAAIVFVDAGLPGPGVFAAPMAPPAFAETLGGLAGRARSLPPWPTWWPRTEIEPLFGSSEGYEDALRRSPRLPAAYPTATVMVPPGWEEGRRAYLAFGEGYAQEAARARHLGWRLKILPDATHLHLLTEPEGVARRVLRLVHGW